MDLEPGQERYGADADLVLRRFVVPPSDLVPEAVVQVGTRDHRYPFAVGVAGLEWQFLVTAIAIVTVEQPNGLVAVSSRNLSLDTDQEVHCMIGRDGNSAAFRLDQIQRGPRGERGRRVERQKRVAHERAELLRSGNEEQHCQRHHEARRDAAEPAGSAGAYRLFEVGLADVPRGFLTHRAADGWRQRLPFKVQPIDDAILG